MDAGCLDPDTISDLIGGVLAPEDLIKAEEHLSWCDDCAEVVGVVARHLDADGQGTGHPSEVASNRDGVPTVVAIPSSSREKRARAIAHAADVDGVQEDVSTTQAPGVARRAPRTGTLTAGTLLGRYEVRRFIGRGGMGDVYEGFDHHLERRVALKVIRDAGDTESARQRLAREARTLARLSHPNVVAAHDVGLEGRHVFLVMELVEGPTLAQWLRAEPRTWRQILDMFLEAGEGLAAAHAVGIVHRDFKPQNVLIGTDGKPRVSDFGLARSDGPVGEGAIEGAPGGEDTDQSASYGPAVGTPRYMAPEQILGNPVDARADQFSFCVALYEALFEVHPFAMGDARFPEVVGPKPAIPANRNSLEIPKSAIIANRPTTPRRNEHHVPRSIAAALERGLTSGPALRFESMRSLLDALRKPRAAGRRRMTLAVGTVIVAISLGGAAGWAPYRKPSPIVLTPIGEPVDWSTAPVFFKVPDQILCLEVLNEKTVRVVWGNPQQVDDVNVFDGSRRRADLVPDAYRYGCPQVSPDGQKLIYEGYDSKQRPHIFYATNPRGERAEAIVSCASPTHRSEPLWLSPNEFVFDSDLMHPAVFSLEGSRTSIIPDSGRPKLSGNGFFKAVSRRGERIAVTQIPDALSSTAIFVYRWPGLDLDYAIVTKTRGSVWRFGASTDRLYGWTATSADDWIVAYEKDRQTLSNFARVMGRHASDLLEISPRRRVLTTRRIESRVRFLDRQGNEQEVPSAGALDGSPSLTPSGDVIFARELGPTTSIFRWQVASGRLDQLTEGPSDWPVVAMSDSTFLVNRADPDGHRALYRCSFGAGTDSTDCKVTRAPFSGFQLAASPDGKWMAYVEAGQSAAVLRLLSLATGETTELNANAGTCQIIWSGLRTLWASLRVADSFRWTELDIETKAPTGRSSSAAGGCFSGRMDPDPPLRTGAWSVEHHDYDLRLIDK